MLRNAGALPLLVGVAAATAAATATSEAAKPCTAYAFWTDKGCRTWSTPCTRRVPSSRIETLSVRAPGTSNFTVVAKGEICAGAPDFKVRRCPALPLSHSFPSHNTDSPSWQTNRMVRAQRRPMLRAGSGVSTVSTVYTAAAVDRARRHFLRGQSN